MTILLRTTLPWIMLPAIGTTLPAAGAYGTPVLPHTPPSAQFPTFDPRRPTQVPRKPIPPWPAPEVGSLAGERDSLTSHAIYA